MENYFVIYFFLPWNRAVFLPFVATCLFLITAVWVGGEWLLSVNMADHHTSSHMPASMIDGCSLSWTKWKVHAFESDKGLVCLPEKCVSPMCVCPPAARVFLFPFREFLLKMHTQACRDTAPCDSLREFELVSHGLGHCMHICIRSQIDFTLFSHPLPSVRLLVHLCPFYTAAQWSRSVFLLPSLLPLMSIQTSISEGKL